MLPPAPVIRTQRPATAKLLKLSLWNGLRSGKSAPKSASKGRFMSRCLNQYRRVNPILPYSTVSGRLDFTSAQIDGGVLSDFANLSHSFLSSSPTSEFKF